MAVLCVRCSALVASAGTVRQYSAAGCADSALQQTQMIPINSCTSGVLLTCTSTTVTYQTFQASGTCGSNPGAMAMRNVSQGADFCIAGTTATGVPNNVYWKLDCSSAAAASAMISLAAIVAAVVAHRFTL